MIFLKIIGIALLLSACSIETIKQHGRLTEPAGEFQIQQWGVPFQGDLNGPFMESMLYLPPNHQPPYPLLVLSHGTPRIASRRRGQQLIGYITQAQWFANQGYATLVLVRRGYGKSQGNYAEYHGSCDSRNYTSSGNASARDILSAVDYFQAMPNIKDDGAILVGQSAGGFGSIAATGFEPKTVDAVINFAGGRGSPRPHFVCSPSALVDAMRTFRKGNNIPSLWIYTENDQYFSPSLAKNMYDTYQVNGNTLSELHIFPPIGDDGHNLFSFADNVSEWARYVIKFLKKVEASKSSQ